MKTPSFDVRFELEGWMLFWADVELTDAGQDQLPHLLDDVARRVRARYEGSALTDDPTVTALRKLFRRAGTDPTRYRPSSEALLRRLVKGEDLPLIHPFVDINNCLVRRARSPVLRDGRGNVRATLCLSRGCARRKLHLTPRADQSRGKAASLRRAGTARHAYYGERTRQSHR